MVITKFRSFRLSLIKKGIVFLIGMLVWSCVQRGKHQYEKSVNESKEQQNEYVNEISCPPDTLLSHVNNNLFTEILDIYIDTEDLKAKEDFIFVSSHCWTDSTYSIFLAHRKWNRRADSLVYRGANKVSMYRDIDLYLSIIGSSRFPIPNQLDVKDKVVEDRDSDIRFIPPIEDEFSIHMIYYPKENCLLGGSTVGGVWSSYDELFKAKGIMK